MTTDHLQPFLGATRSGNNNSAALIPVIDLAPARSGGAAAVGKALHEAFVESGFCYIRNHGVSQTIITEAAENALEFFHLPIEGNSQAPLRCGSLSVLG